MEPLLVCWPMEIVPLAGMAVDSSSGPGYIPLEAFVVPLVLWVGVERTYFLHTQVSVAEPEVVRSILVVIPKVVRALAPGCSSVDLRDRRSMVAGPSSIGSGLVMWSGKQAGPPDQRSQDLRQDIVVVCSNWGRGQPA